MIMMMNSVVEKGTGRRARLDGIAAAGKTGTTNAYRDAWFVGYTGNFVCGVWFGNDDYTSTNRMTGGSLPAMTWHSIMAYAHQGIELKQLPGVAVPPRQPQAVAEAKANAKEAPPPRPVDLDASAAPNSGSGRAHDGRCQPRHGPAALDAFRLRDRRNRSKRRRQADAMATALEGKSFGSRN